MVIRSVSHAAALALVIGLASKGAAASCDDLSSATAPLAVRSATVTARDLIELRDIGNAGIADPTSPISVSPDGRQIAFQIRRADVASNSYCLGMFILPLDGTSPAREIDHGGEPIMWPGLWFGAITPKLSGYLEVNQPSWSPDGRWVYYLRRDQGVTQVWRASADGTVAAPVTHSAIDITAFQWGSDGRSLLLQDLPHYPIMEAAIAREGLGGFRYDDRWQLDDDATKPLVFDRETPRVRRVDPVTGEDLSPGAALVWHDMDDEHLARAPDGRIARIIPEHPANIVSEQSLEIRRDNPSVFARCEAAECRGRLAGVWWDRHGTDLLFLRYEGWAHETSALYRWRPGSATAVAILRTQAFLTGCRSSASDLLCMSESALQPRSIVAIDDRSGAIHRVFEPNPEWTGLRLGSVTRLRWTNALGLEAFGDLVLPPGHRPGELHPLVITQYQSKGFLRGGTGDAYPIQLMAAAGYAVLSTQDPGLIGARKPTSSEIELNRRDVVHAADARSGLSSLEAGLRRAEATGTIDPSKIAITGLSDGAFKARYAILHSHLFKTALISSCCDDPTSDALLGMQNMARRHAYGWPRIGDFSNPHWRYFSLLARSRDFNIPLLIQSSTHEFLGSIATVAAMQQAHRPVDLYVYPNEFHVLSQPAHRAAYYQRDLDWLDFWLRDTIPAHLDPVRASDFSHWQTMRAAWRAAGPARGAVARQSKLPHRIAEASEASHPSEWAARP